MFYFKIYNKARCRYNTILNAIQQFEKFKLDNKKNHPRNKPLRGGNIRKHKFYVKHP